MLNDKAAKPQPTISGMTLLGQPAVGPDIETPQTVAENTKTRLNLEVAAYICQMSAELSAMARNSELSLLSYFLDMAAAEARAAEEVLRGRLPFEPDPDNDALDLPDA